jgi:hypothetical protein
VGIEHRLDVPVPLGRAQLIARLELGAQVGTFGTREPDEPAPEPDLLALITCEASPVRGQRIGEASGVERRLGGAGAGMRAHHEGGVADECDPPENDLWRRQIGWKNGCARLKLCRSAALNSSRGCVGSSYTAMNASSGVWGHRDKGPAVPQHASVCTR